jgi:hypothetical protein
MLTRTDQEAMLACVHEHLADEGQFFFDNLLMLPEQMVEDPEEVPWYTVTHPNGREIHASGTQWFDHARQWYIQRCHERWDSAEGELVRSPRQITLRYVMPQEMEALLHYNGVKIIARYDDYQGDPVSPEAFADIYLCEKQ